MRMLQCRIPQTLFLIPSESPAYNSVASNPPAAGAAPIVARSLVIRLTYDLETWSNAAMYRLRHRERHA
jgi:hypothetical protein